MLNGIDISNHQGKKDIKLSQVGSEFVICKATEGVGWKDPYFEGFMHEAARLGKKLGMYHFARKNDAIAEANYFVESCKGWFGSAIPVLDFEDEAIYNGVAWAHRFMSQVYKLTGVECLIYMSSSVTTKYDWSSVVKSGYDLWVAAYHDNKPRNYDQTGVFNWKTGAWEHPVMWQFTSTGRLGGYDGNLDLNKALFDNDMWDRYVKGTAHTEPEPEPEPEFPKEGHYIDFEGGHVWVQQTEEDKIDIGIRFDK